MRKFFKDSELTKADINDSLVISCSEDNYIYVWSNDDKEIKNYFQKLHLLQNIINHPQIIIAKQNTR